MIRIGLPPPVWPRLRASAIGVQSRAERQARAWRTFRGRVRERAAGFRRAACGRLAAPFLRRARAREEGMLMAFEDRYEALVDLLCWTAKEGVMAEREARYRELRSWMRAHYASVCPRLRPFWAEESAPGPDPFEALFAPESVGEAINAPDGIEVMMRTRAALESYHAAHSAPRPDA